MAKRSPIVTLTTDYGTSDYYVAVLKAVILGIVPDARLVDITHDIAPQNVTQGAFVLWQAWSWFPAGTVHLVVVDPGVGTERQIIAGKYDGRYVVAPDNGLVTFVHRDRRIETVHVVEDRRYFLSQLSSTFHGRDIMAPVAARLASGVSIRLLGRVCEALALLPVPHRAAATGAALEGTVLYADRFGTLVTNIHADQMASGQGPAKPWTVSVGDQVIGPVQSTFASVPVGESVALFGGGGLLEIAVNQGRAVDRFGTDVIVTARR